MRKTVFAAALLTAALSAQAAVPQRLNFQARLTDSGGTPIDGIVVIQFSLYDAPTNGTEQWTETQSVAVVEGLMSVQLGSSNPITAAVLTSAPDLYLAVNVESDGEMDPRFRLASAAFAIVTDGSSHTHSMLSASDGDPPDALSVDAAGDVHLEGSVRYNTPHTGYLQLPVPAFTLGMSTWWWTASYESGYIISGAPNVYASVTAPINLPDGAVIQEITVYAVDNEASANLVLDVYLRSVATSDGSTQAHETGNFTTSGASPNRQTFTVPVLPNVTVNNAARQYALRVSFNPNPYQGSNITFNGATIRYTVSRVAP